MIQEIENDINNPNIKLDMSSEMVIKNFWEKEVTVFNQLREDISKKWQLREKYPESLILNQTMVDNLKQMFPHKVTSFKPLFRASEEEFKAAKFHNKCDNVKGTIVIVESEFGKVFGGFNADTWNGGDPKNN